MCACSDHAWGDNLEVVLLSQIRASAPSGATSTECPQGFEGTQPNCFPIGNTGPAAPQCKEGFTGVPPNCDLVAPQDLA
ncbi:MAG: hypothetical protein GEU26_13765 [Nitrososphaeraceae archaeon]|nr:hypothetical protein [Nitrososphaeraceae archaeon]